MNKLNLDGIETIIFDLGKVIINLDMDETYNQLESIFGKQYEQAMAELNAQNIFTDYETGKINTTAFVDAIHSKTHSEATKENIITAWNAMLGDIPEIRFNILENAKNRFQTFCLSNTNELHIQWIENWLGIKKGTKSLDPYFHKVYYSHEMGQRKPNVEIFETVINHHNLDPNKTLFIDDTAGHLVGAKKAGLNTFHLAEGMRLEDIFE